jgi:hypothetical protein
LTTFAAVETARRSPEWHASTEDEANFLDPEHHAFFLTVEREIPTARPETRD